MDKHSETHPELIPLERMIKKEIYTSFPLLIIVSAIPFLAFNSFLRPDDEVIGTWFQRSGSIMVFLSLWIEFKLFKISKDIYLNGVVTGPEERLAKKYKFMFETVKYLGVVGALIGTIIWGYGDVLHKFLT